MTDNKLYKGELGNVTGIKLTFMTSDNVDGILIVCDSKELTEVMKKTFSNSFKKKD